MVQSEGNMSLKNPVTPPGIDPGTVRLVAQCLNHYATPGPLCMYIITYLNKTNICILSTWSFFFAFRETFNINTSSLSFTKQCQLFCYRNGDHACLLRGRNCVFGGAFAKLRKATVSFVKSVRPSVRMDGTTRPPLEGLS